MLLSYVKSLGPPLTPSQISPGFLRVCSTSLLKTRWEKEKLLVTSNFSFSHSVFHPFQRTFCDFRETQNCSLQTLSVWKSLKFVVWERVKHDKINPDLNKPWFLLVCIASLLKTLWKK